ncbi:hypothetical protein Ocin01_01562 [Orchesella cincta]|uniref:Uncharacterized protein n=1 Tax=Orchesella cincta TaxID=48709 RepID=A0A1D2NJA3_ORCCI|nr:hypothetical protein Ocin01_01562 [Orchesella cincta]
MNATYELGILSPLSQYLQEGGTQQTSSMGGTPRPGTPRGSGFRLSPDGNLGNPGTPGASHDHHKFPNSPWSGSDPATPGYNRNVVPSSPYISSYPNTPATPGGGGYYQKPNNGGSINGHGTTSVPPGSPWTERSVCTPGPMTPMTPATPMHSTSEQGNGFSSNNGSPTFPEHTINSGKGATLFSGGLVQDALTDALLPVSVVNHNHHNQAPPPPPPPPVSVQNNGNANVALHNNPPYSETERSQAVDHNPNLIKEFEDFLAEFMAGKTRKEKEQDNAARQQQQQQQQPPPQQQNNPPHQQQPQQPLPPHNMPPHMGNGSGMMYNPMPNNNNGGQPSMMMNNPHMNSGQMQSSAGPMRGRYNMGPNGHPGGGHPHPHHPYMMSSNNSMMRSRQVPVHNMQPSNQYTATSAQNHGGMPPHPNSMGGNMMNGNMNGLPPQQQPPPQSQFGHPGHQLQSASIYAPPPSNNGGYVQQQQHQHPQSPMQPQPGNPVGQYMQQQHANNNPVHWQPPPQQMSMNNHNGPPTPNPMLVNNGNMPNNIGGGNNNASRGIPQPNSYFQNPVNSPSMPPVEQGHNNGNNNGALPSFPFNSMSPCMSNNNVAGGTPTNNNQMAINSGTSAMPMGQQQQQMVKTPSQMSLPPTPQTPSSSMPPIEDLNIDLDGPYDGTVLNQTVWNKAAEKASRTNPVIEIGKVLFDEIFTDDEIVYCTLSGRGSTQKFNPNKVHVLKRAVAWLMTRPPRPWEFNVDTCDASLGSDDESGIRGLEKKVFTEYRSRKRGDIMKARNQST